MDSYQSGYSTLAAIEDSDPNFLIYRKFGWLRNRLLLGLQDELVTLEEELEHLDKNDARLGDLEGVLASRRNDELEQTLRQDLLKTIRQKLSEYGMGVNVSFCNLGTKHQSRRGAPSPDANPSHQTSD